MNKSYSERIIEDILSADKSILSEILSVYPSNISLIARQKIVSSGKIDLLYICNDELLLVELKAVPFYRAIITQINGYEKDLIDLQQQNKLILSSINKVVLVTETKQIYYEECNKNNITLIVYKPEAILSKYYENFKELSSFLKIRAGDYGVVRLGLLKSVIDYISQGKNIDKICEVEMKSIKTIRNRISVAQHLNLVSKFKNQYYLTELGNEFVKSNQKIVDDTLDHQQIDLLSNFINQNPFFHQSRIQFIL